LHVHSTSPYGFTWVSQLAGSEDLFKNFPVPHFDRAIVRPPHFCHRHITFPPCFEIEAEKTHQIRHFATQGCEVAGLSDHMGCRIRSVSQNGAQSVSDEATKAWESSVLIRFVPLMMQRKTSQCPSSAREGQCP